MRTFLNRSAAAGIVVGLILGSFVPIGALGSFLALSIVSPSQNQTVAGAVTFYAQADAAGIVSFQWKVDGQNYGLPLTAGSCRASWDSTLYADGSAHVIQAEGLDAGGARILAAPITVTVANATPPPPPPPSQQLATLTLSPASVVEGQASQATAKDAAGNVLAGVTWGFDVDFVGGISASGLITGATLKMLPASTTSRATPIRATLAGVTVTATLTITRGTIPPPPPPPVPAPVLVLPVAGASILPSFMAEASFAAGATSARFELRSPTTGAVLQAWPFTFGDTATTLQRMLTIDTPIAGPYKFAAVVGSAVSTVIDVTVTVPAPPPPPPGPTTDPVVLAEVQAVRADIAAVSARLSTSDASTGSALQQILTAASQAKADLTPTALAAIANTFRLELAAALTPQAPKTCRMEIRSIGTNYSDGDYSVTFKVAKGTATEAGCILPVRLAVWHAINVK